MPLAKDGKDLCNTFSFNLRSSAFGRAFQQILPNLRFCETAQVIELVVVEESLFMDYRHVLVLELLLLVDGSLGEGPRVQVTKVLLEDLCSLVQQPRVYKRWILELIFPNIHFGGEFFFPEFALFWSQKVP